MSDRRFRIAGPAVVNVSGGRTSGFMLHQILDAHDGQLPADVVPVFCNTGREMPATLDFVEEMSRRWGVHIQWLEYRYDLGNNRAWAEPVNHNSASRNGEPFEMMLEAKGWLLPNVVTSFCTIELKIRTTQRWLTSEYGWRRYISVVGLRADEMNRVAGAGRRNAAKKERFRVSCPLAKARITKAEHVGPFWRAAPFDLRLRGDWEGNCDFCFKKRLSRIERMTLDYPDRLSWWAVAEARGAHRGTGGRFRLDRPSYADIAENVRISPPLPMVFDPADSGFDVLADCEGGCGV